MKKIKDFFVETIILITVAAGWGIVRIFRFFLPKLKKHNENNENF